MNPHNLQQIELFQKASWQNQGKTSLNSSYCPPGTRMKQVTSQRLFRKHNNAFTDIRPFTCNLRSSNALVICFLRPPPPPRHSGTLSGNSGGITAALRWFYAQTPGDFTSNLPDLKYPRETPGEFSKTKRSRGDCVQRILGAFLTSSDPTWLPESVKWG